MTSRELWDIINTEHANLLFYLWERWQDEREYEDIGEYLKIIQSKLPMAYAITKRPFGIKLKASDRAIKVEVQRKGNTLVLLAKPL